MKSCRTKEIVYYAERQQDPPRLVLPETVAPQIGGLFLSKVRVQKPAPATAQQVELPSHPAVEYAQQSKEFAIARELPMAKHLHSQFTAESAGLE